MKIVHRRSSGTIVNVVGILMVLCEMVHGISSNSLTDNTSSTYRNGRHSSVLTDERVETFKRDILRGLGYDRPPSMGNVTTSIEEKRRLIEEYRKYIAEKYPKEPRLNGLDDDSDEDDKIQSKTVYSLQHTGGVPTTIRMQDWVTHEAVRMYFSSQLPRSSDDNTKQVYVHSAKLKVFINEARPDRLRDKHTIEKQVRINAYQIVSINSSFVYSRTLLDSKLIPLYGPGWAEFDISKAVQEWINDKRSNFGIELAAESQNIHDVVTIDVSMHANDVTRINSTMTSPSVDVYTQERNILKRVKRRSRHRKVCRRSDGQSKCCRYPIRISFRDIGWDDWVIAPMSYKGYYCAGSCEYGHLMAHTFSGIQARLHFQQPDKVPSPCCVATKLSPFTLLHYDYDGKYTFSDYPNLVVEQCRCG